MKKRRTKPAISNQQPGGGHVDLTSFDNVSEEDGIVLLHGFLSGLNAEAKANPADPQQRRLVAIVPEYRDGGQTDAGGFRFATLDRLNVLTCQAGNPGQLTDAEAALMEAATAVAVERKARHDAAVKKLESHPVHVIHVGKPTP